jgi:methionine-R-sulfoxide reductase
MAACSQLIKREGQNTMNKKTVVNKTVEHKTEQQWKAQLTDEEYHVCREKGTERPFSGELLNNKQQGIYRCKCCDSELFTSDSKFNSGCGWPSFDKEIKPGAVIYTPDNSLAMQRIEITCSQCDAHLGHIFPDGPTDTGQRFCVNSISMDFKPEPKPQE